tara:strand:+ start:58 stop:546 length:489 start_codon:yes stop_codon:yes gene_type:complete
MDEPKTTKAKAKKRAPPGVTAKRNTNAKRAGQRAKRASVSLPDLTAVEYKRQKLIELRGDIEMCRHTGRVTALAQLHKLEKETKEELEHVQRAASDPIADMTPGELLAFVQSIVLSLPPSLQDQIAATLGAVRSRNVVRLSPPHADQDHDLKITGEKTRGSR